MNTYRIYTRKTMGLDNRVWLTMFIIIIISLFLLSYRLIDKKECMPVNFTIKVLSAKKADTIYTIGETLFFKASSSSQDITWDFGDKSEKGYGRDVNHRFQSEGVFLITAGTGAGCENVKQILVKKPLPVVDSVMGEGIAGPAVIVTGRDASFTCLASADSYDWTIEDHPNMMRTGSSVKFVFPRAGQYFVQVTLDADRNKRYRKEILVQDDVEDKPLKQGGIPKKIDRLIDEKPYVPPVHEEVKELIKPKADSPVVALSTTKKTIFISDRTFLNYLIDVGENKMSAADFDKYLCGSGGTPVIVNGNKSEMKTFAWLCTKLSSKEKKLIFFKKTIKVESAMLHRINDCVTLIDVKY